MSKASSSDFKASVKDPGPPLSPLSRDAREPSSAWRIVLGLVIAMYVTVAVIHAIRTPTGANGYQDAPDEQAHVIEARVIAAGRLPTLLNPGTSPADRSMAYEWHQPPLYYFLVARLASAGVRGMRLLSVLIGVGCIVLIYRAAHILLPERPETAVLAACIAALIPGHIAMTSVVNNDGLLELCFSAYLLVMLNAFARGLTLRRSIMLGVILGAALLTKVTALLLLPLTALGLALQWRGGEQKRDLAQSALAIIVTAVLLSGWWYARNSILYHEVLPMTAFRQAFEGTTKATDVVYGRMGIQVDGWTGYAALVAVLTLLSFFAVYGTRHDAVIGNQSFLPIQLYLLAALVSCAALSGLVLFYVRERQKCVRFQTAGFWLLAATLMLVTASFMRFTAEYFQAQGRYFYPAMLPIALFAALGWQTLIPRRYQSIASGLLLGFLSASCLDYLLVTGWWRG